jgi:hypothetical protein
MESSGGIPAGENGTGEGQAGSEQQAQVDAPERDSGYDRLSQQFEGFINDFGEWREKIDSRFAEPEDDGAGGEPDEVPFSPDEFFQEDGTITPDDLQQWIDQAAEKKAQEFVKPLQQQMSQAQAAAEQRRLEQAADTLEEKYPILGDEEYQERFIQTAQQQAMALAQAVGNPELAETLWRQPEFMENIHLAMQARERAENEVPAGSEGGLTLERGGSMGPTGPIDDEAAIRDRIVNAKG